MNAPMTARQQADRVIAIANLALAQHIVDHHLPAPLEISLPSFVDEDKGLNIRVVRGDLDQWLDSLNVDKVTTQVHDHDVFGRWTVTSYAVRLPDTGTCVVLTSTAPAATLAVI